jgi:hypothetical protein
MNTKQIRLITTASTRENPNARTRKKITTPKAQIIKDVKQEEKVKHASSNQCFAMGVACVSWKTSSLITNQFQ